MWLFLSMIEAPPKPREARAERSDLDRAMDAYAEGDEKAFRTIYRELLPRLRGFLARMSGDSTTAEDLSQEALLRIHRARGSFEAGAAALPWAMAIARNAYLDHVRRARSRPKSIGGTTDEEGKRPDPVAVDARPDDMAMANESAEIVKKTLESLPLLQREAFILIRFEGLSVAEAAEVQGAGESAVKVRAFRAYEALRLALGAKSGGGE